MREFYVTERIPCPHCEGTGTRCIPVTPYLHKFREGSLSEGDTGGWQEMLVTEWREPCSFCRQTGLTEQNVPLAEALEEWLGTLTTDGTRGRCLAEQISEVAGKENCP